MTWLRLYRASDHTSILGYPPKSKRKLSALSPFPRLRVPDAFRPFYLVVWTPQVSVFLVKVCIFIAPFVVFYATFLDTPAPSTCIFKLSSHRHRKRSRSHKKSHQSSTHKSPKRSKSVASKTTKHNEDVLEQILQSANEFQADFSVCNSRISGLEAPL